MNGMARDIKSTTLLLKPSSIFSFLVYCTMARLPDKTAITMIVENVTILADSTRDLLKNVDTSLSTESISNAAIRIDMAREENLQLWPARC